MTRSGERLLRGFPAVWMLIALAAGAYGADAGGTTAMTSSSAPPARVAVAPVVVKDSVGAAGGIAPASAPGSTLVVEPKGPSPVAATPASSTLAQPGRPEVAMVAPVAASSTIPGAAPAFRQGAPGAGTQSAANPGVPATGKQPPAKAGVAATGKQPAAKTKDEAPPAYLEDLHKRAVIVNLPTAYAAHVGKATGENAEVFLAWYIGSLYRYDEVGDYDRVRGLFIQQIMSLYIGADLKWAFLRESSWRPALAAGYYGGFGLPSFAGGTVKASTTAKDVKADKNKVKREEAKSGFMHNGYAVMSKQFSWLTISAGALYGFKRAYPAFIPMLRNSSFTTVSNPASGELVTVFGGLDLAWKYRHFKVEIVTVPMEPSTISARPWLIQTHIDDFIGFDFALVRDAVGYQVVGYYVLPFIQWPDKKRLTKEYDRTRARKR